jgi:hypothetical protein
LKLFWANVRTAAGEQYKKSSLQLIKYGLTKYFKQQSNINIGSPEFDSSNVAYKAVVVDLVKKGLGEVTHKPPIAPEDLQLLYNQQNIAFNVGTPCGLQRKVWFDLMLFICRRGRENLREMTKTTFGVGTDATRR